MEDINYLNNNGLIWDDKYFYTVLSKDDIKANLEDIKKLIISILRGMNREYIGTNFYYLAKNITRAIMPMINPEQLLDVHISMCFDAFLPAEVVQEHYVYEPKLFKEGCTIKSFYEYFIVTRSLINYDLDACIPFMHKIDVNNTEILEYYNNVRDRLYMSGRTGWNTKSAKR